MDKRVVPGVRGDECLSEIDVEGTLRAGVLGIDVHEGTAQLVDGLLIPETS